MKNLPIYFLDTETTGLNPKSEKIIEFCIIKHSRFSTHSIHYKVDPEGAVISPEAQRVNGYTKEKWIGQISQEEASRIICDFMKDEGIVCGHNVSFDISFIDLLLKKNGRNPIGRRRKIDTYGLAYEHLVPMGLKSLSFDEIRLFLGWKVHKNHDAKTDTWDVFRLYTLICRMGTIKKVYIWIKSLKYRIGI